MDGILLFQGGTIVFVLARSSIITRTLSVRDGPVVSVLMAQ